MPTMRREFSSARCGDWRRSDYPPPEYGCAGCGKLFQTFRAAAAHAWTPELCSKDQEIVNWDNAKQSGKNSGLKYSSATASPASTAVAILP